MALLTKNLVAHHLSVNLNELTRIIKEDDLPHTLIPGKTKPRMKFMPYALFKWERERSSGTFPTFDEWIQQLDLDTKEYEKKHLSKTT